MIHRHTINRAAPILAASLALILTAAGPSFSDTKLSEVVVISGFSTPESVLLNGARRYVSNVGTVLDPLAKDGDGFISTLAADGQILNLHAFPPAGETLDAPKGMAIAGNTLYVTDIDRVVGFDLDSGARIFEADLPVDGPAMANDLAMLDAATLLVSDTLRNLVYQLDLGSGVFTEFATGIPGANGLVVDPKDAHVFVVGVGEGFVGGDVFELEGDAVPRRLASGPHGILDGVAQVRDGGVIVSDWVDLANPVPGKLWLVPADGTAIKQLITELEIHGPADFVFDSEDQTLWIPAMLENSVVIAPLAGW